MPTFESIDVFDSKKNILRFDGYFVVPVLVLSFSLAISAVLHKNEKDRIESDLTRGFIQEKNEIHKKFREKLRNYGFTLRGLRN